MYLQSRHVLVGEGTGNDGVLQKVWKFNSDNHSQLQILISACTVPWECKTGQSFL